MERVLFAILETSIIMSGAILLLMLFSKLFAGKTRPAKRHLCWLIVAVGLLVPYRPALLTVPLPQPQPHHEAEALLFANNSLMLDWAGFEHSLEGGTYLNPDFPVITDPAISDCNILMPGLEPGGSLDTRYNPATTLENPTTLENSAALESPEEIILISVIEMEEMVAVPIYPAELTILRDILLPSLLAVWALGALGIILFYALRHIRFIRRVKKNSHEITFGPLHNLLIRIRCHAGIKRKVRLMTGPFITVPMMYGFFRPVIILPAYVLTSNEEQQRLIVLHEALHIKRGDIIARLLFLAAVAVHWFNPLVHLMNRLALDESERACDDAVLRYSGVETRKQYSHTLLQVARQDAEAHDALTHDALVHEALAHALTNGGKNMKNRLKNILSQQKPGRLALLICTALMVVGVIVFSLVNFTGRGDYGPETDGVLHVLIHDGTPIRITTPAGEMESIVRNTANAFYDAHGLQADITSYSTWEQHDEYVLRTLAQMSLEQGPEIFVFRNRIPLYRFIENGLLMDINEIIPDRAPFFDTVLRGHEISGSLYVFPLSFGFDMVGINAKMPPAFIQRFSEMEAISQQELLTLYSDLITAHPEFASYYFLQSLTWLDLPLRDAINFEAREAIFPDWTEQFKYDIRRYVLDNLGDNPTFQSAERVHENTVFYIPHGQYAVGEAFFPYESELFMHFIPVVDHDGKIIDRSWGYSVAVNANADPAVAWAFINALVTASARDGLGGGSGNVPILRRYAYDYIIRGVEQDLAHVTTRPLTSTRDEAVTTAAARILSFTDRPFVRPYEMQLVPIDVIWARHAAFARSDETAQTAIKDMEALLVDWMNTPRPIDLSYAPVEPEAPMQANPELPARYLTIHAGYLHSAIFQQAADAMNASWQSRGIPYNFELVLDEYDWRYDLDLGNEARNARLQTALMAGQGPDIFIVNQGMNLRNFARNGFLSDFYELMDNCERTERTDFFENVLEAFEFDGGLYIFPTSFSFFQAGINASLPEQYINRFAESGMMTIAEMLDIYESVHSNELYAHLETGLTSGWGHPAGMLPALLPPFVNFSTRESNVMDARFVEQLDVMRRVLHRLGYVRVPSGGSPLHDLRGVAELQVFEMGNHMVMGASAYFPRPADYFVHYRPVMTEAGQLIIDPGEFSTVWALLAVNAMGDTQLAWEFIWYLLREYPNATGRARILPGWGIPAFWAGRSLATPILRETADMTRASFEYVTGGNFTHDWLLGGRRDEYIDMAMERLAELNEMPMALIHPMIPREVFMGPEQINLSNFMAGVIPAEVFAQMIHNSLSLWLIE